MTTTTPELTAVPVTRPHRALELWKDQKWVILSLAAVYVIWGSTYLALKYLIAGLPPLVAVGGRYLLAGAVLYGFLRLRGAPAPTRRQWLGAIPTGVLLFLVGNGFVTLAERDVPSSVAAIVCATTPLLTALFQAFSTERPSRRELVGLAIGFAGVAVMTMKGLAGASLSATLILIAPLGWSLGIQAARRLDQPVGLVGAATQMLAGGVATLVAGFARGESLPTEVPLKAGLAFVYLVVFGSLVAFSAFSYLLSRTRPSVATSYAYVNPVVALGLGIVVGGETLFPATVFGALLVVAGVVIVVRSKKSPRATATQDLRSATSSPRRS